MTYQFYGIASKTSFGDGLENRTAALSISQRRTRPMMRLILLPMLPLLLCAKMGATSIDPMLWEEMLEAADFVGIVECVTAGGIVAKYKVLECWKGAESPRAEIAIRTEIDYCEPQYPLALCRQKAFGAVYKDFAPCQFMSFASEICPPTLMRKIQWDYASSLFHGMELDPEQRTWVFGEKNFSEFRNISRRSQMIR